MITMLFKHEFLRTWKLVLVAIGGGAVIAALQIGAKVAMGEMKWG